MNKINIYNFDVNLYKFLNNDEKLDNSIESIQNMKKKCLNSDKIYSLNQLLEKLPLNFDINEYVKNNNLEGRVAHKYDVISHYLKNNAINNNNITWKSTIIDKKNDIKSFVLVFPQFHEIPENNKFWGKGFTEWWNVEKTMQLHDKHLPINPHEDIGKYNALDYSTRKRWNDYAEKYGFFGYIFYHYNFSDGLVMNKPLDKLLEDGQPDKPWFLSWVNENWTKRWDGGNNDILLEVKYDEDKCYTHFNNILKYLKHQNYYKVNNKPFLAIYKASDVPKFYLDIFNKLAIDNGFDGITYISTLNNRELSIDCIYNDDYCEYEFEFPPNYSGTLPGTGPLSNTTLMFNKKLCKKQVNYTYNYNIENHLKALTLTLPKNKKLIRGIVPSWDNFPRHANLDSCCFIQLHSNSFIFYLVLVKQFILLKKEKCDYHVINALNEWAEQCVMEPSIQNEYSYLEAFNMAIHTNLDKINIDLLDKLINF